MANSYFHAKSAARRFGGVPEDYQAVEDFFDQTKMCWADVRHRAILHSSFGIFLAEQMFGHTITRASDGVKVPTRVIGELHVQEDLGFIPTLENWLDKLPYKEWMLRGAISLTRPDTNIADVQEDGAVSTPKAASSDESPITQESR